MQIVTWDTPIIITEAAQDVLCIRAVLLALIAKALPYAEDDTDLNAAINDATAALYGEALPDEDDSDGSDTYAALSALAFAEWVPGGNTR